MVGGLIIGDIAVDLRWACVEILFYAAITLLTGMSLASIDFADGLRVYRMFLVITTAIAGLFGFLGGLILVLFSTVTTPTFGQQGYLWPLFPFHWNSLKTLLFRYPSFKAQPGEYGKHK